VQAGQGGQVILLGSHFTFRGFAKQYKALLPAGGSGAFHGRYLVRGEGEEGRKTPESAPKPARESDETPSLEELAGMLEALDG
jgi:hypothetical protein